MKSITRKQLQADISSLRSQLLVIESKLDDVTRSQDPNAQEAVRSLLTMMYLYKGYETHSRGPQGCVYDAIKTLDPAVGEYLQEHDWDATYKRFYPSDNG